jgi:hypothetical protein
LGKARGEPIPLRLAANDAAIVFRLPVSAISSPDLKLMANLQKNLVRPGEFCVTDSVLQGVGEKVANQFSFKTRYAGKPIFSCLRLSVAL